MAGISILMYHQVGRFAPMTKHRANYCDVDRFRAQMRYLKQIGASVLSMSDALDALAGHRPLPARAVVLTFDDGCDNFYENALPILEDFAYPAIVYVIAGMAGGTAAWMGDVPGHGTPPLMSFARIRELPARGIEVGSHGYQHIRLAGTPAATLLHEVTDSKRRIEDETGRAVPHFCYPYGSHDLATVEAVAAAGYRTGVTCQRGAATAAFDPLALPRKGISFGDNVLGYAWKLHMKDKPKGEAVRRAEPATAS
ncbi:polysaccharide deacetylase family protein [Solimonas terrae]|uniref:Polysaccharide deacetylase family protein n=1 Tax=Solimonas terrae TaxID=1396819 RepID=A0A6M2BSR3_9GAMM|nr:polysaccharide deacetylase family protein [Solimonas terrae]NGY05404.1 polysaccharide deacetylase family protein [Solimonas terrae]